MAMSRNTVVLDDELWVFDHETDDRVVSYKTTLLGSYLGEQEVLSSAQAIAQIYWCYRSGYQVTTE